MVLRDEHGKLLGHATHAELMPLDPIGFLDRLRQAIIDGLRENPDVELMGNLVRLYGGDGEEKQSHLTSDRWLKDHVLYVKTPIKAVVQAKEVIALLTGSAALPRQRSPVPRVMSLDRGVLLSSRS